MRMPIIVFGPLLLVACATVPAEAGDDTLIWARLGETVTVDGPRVTPVRVLEDSRCPIEADCVWAGQVRLEVRVHTGSGQRLREIINRNPIPVADGELELVAVTPEKSSQRPATESDYRFGFRFSGGL